MKKIDKLSADPEMGTELTGRWAGARSEHFADDMYRVIWQMDEDRDAVVVLLVGRKRERHGTIYDRPRPDGSRLRGTG